MLIWKCILFDEKSKEKNTIIKYQKGITEDGLYDYTHTHNTHAKRISFNIVIPKLCYTFAYMGNINAIYIMK